MGLDPAEFQAALWVGADDITGVADSRNLTAAMNQRIANTAKEQDLTEEEAMRQFIQGKILLNQLVPGAVGAGGVMGAGSMFYGGEDNSTTV
jgi:hypothetical protein